MVLVRISMIYSVEWYNMVCVVQYGMYCAVEHVNNRNIRAVRT